MSDEVVLKISHLSKYFGNIKAIENINLEIFKGEIVAFVGDNGAGKSTLMKILSGEYRPSSGEIEIFGEKVVKFNPKSLIKKGITTVYQNLALVDNLDIVSNIFLGYEKRKFMFFLQHRKMKMTAEKLLKNLNINIPSLESEVGELSGGQRQGVAIARAIHQGGRILILDEPTAAMGIKESREVYKLIKSLSKKEITVLIVSHNIQQVFDVADKVYIMKHGNIVNQFKTHDTNYNEIADIILGEYAAC